MSDPASQRQPRALPPWAVIAAVVSVSLVAISGRSLWIDEAATAIQAIQPTLKAWWQLLLQEKTAHLQMPLYMLYIWGYEKLFGCGEWTLRLANLPWFGAGSVAFVLGYPAAERRRLIAALLMLTCPFAWYYLDEARPYAMQLGASLLVLAALRRLAGDAGAVPGQKAGCLLLFLGIVALSGSSLLGMVWAGSACAALAVVVSMPRLLSLLQSNRIACLTGGALLLLLAGYYVWTLKIGARAAAPTTSSLGSVLFIGYDILGFVGLGPGRLELRSVGPIALRSYWVWLALYAVASLSVLGAALWHALRPRNRQFPMLALCAGIPAVLIIGAGWAVHFRALGRHFAPLVAVLLLLFTDGLSVLWARPGLRSRGLVVLFCILSLVSCLSVRFAARHERDNYRAAASLAKAALRKGQSVWWNASTEGARYYAVPLVRSSASSGEALLVANVSRESLSALPPPELIITSKPDIYDGLMAIAEYIHEGGYREVGRLQAFVIWERSSN
jgi:hypothetical protein